MRTTKLALTITLLLTYCLAFAQKKVPIVVSVPIKEVQQVSTEWLELFTPNPKVREDLVLNERLMDLVQVYEIDSIVPKKWARHKVIGGGFIALFGRRWHPLYKTRSKLVGTSIRSYQAPDKPQFTEYDIKYNLVPHLDKYINEAYTAHQAQLKKNARMKGVDKKAPPFIEPTPETLEKYKFHNELTPPKDLHHQLDSLFFPCVHGTRHIDHVNFGEERISMGMYGVVVLDCNHRCWPEMHPYEWVWWLELNPAHDDRPDEKRWLVGLIEEASSRFKAWSKGPRRGVISIPFAFKNGKKQHIQIEHLVTDGMSDAGLQDLTEVPDNAMDFATDQFQVNMGDQQLMLTSDRNMPEGAKWWISDVQTDGDVTRGYLKIAIATELLWTARVTFK